MTYHDPLTGRVVLLAENRAARPNDFAKPAGGCPFCAGNETETPTAVHQLLDDNGNWQVRVVPNKYPAVEPNATRAPHDLDCPGAHEVVIESPQHCTTTTQLGVDGLAKVLQVYGERLEHWRRDGRFEYRLVFRNVGPTAGASLEHLHGQIIALRDLPPKRLIERDMLERHLYKTGNCAWCDQIATEIKRQSRLVLETDHFLAYCPEASIQPYETWLLPKRHHPSFESLQGTDELSRFAEFAFEVTRCVETVIGDAGYNWILQTGELGGDGEPWGHWRLEMVPRLAQFAGLELASGLHLNTVAPERAAQALRSAITR